MKRYDNGLDDLYGIIRIGGNENSVISNHISNIVDEINIRPEGIAPIIIRLVSGTGNYIANNHIVATTEGNNHDEGASEESCFSTQVEAVLATAKTHSIPVVTVHINSEAQYNTVLDSGTESQVSLDIRVNAFRPTPSIPGIC